METKGYWYKEYAQGRRFLIKMLPGESVINCLREFTGREKIQHAVILSAIGSVKNVRLNGIMSGTGLPITPDRLIRHEIEGPLELLSMSGNIVPGAAFNPDCHLHITVSKSSGEAIGGHLADADAFASCEIVLTELVVSGIQRQLSKSGGTPIMFFVEH